MSATHVMLASFSRRDIPDARRVRVVRERDLDAFYVTRVRRDDGGSEYQVENRTAFMSPKTGRTLADVRKIIRGAP